MLARLSICRSCRAVSQPPRLICQPICPQRLSNSAVPLAARAAHSDATHSTVISSQGSPHQHVLHPQDGALEIEPRLDAVSPTHSAKLISTVAELATCLDELSRATALYVDLEGHWLSRIGSLDIISISSHPQGSVSLIDVYALQHAAFSTPSASCPATTLKSLLEDPRLAKYLWDVRNDADALFSLYAVDLAGVTDLQLLELASRKPHPRWGDRKHYVRSLAACIESDLALTPAQLAGWAVTKDSVKALMMPRAEQDEAAAAADVAHDGAGRRVAVELAGNVLRGIVPKVLLKAAQAKEQQHLANEPGKIDAPAPELTTGGEDQDRPAQPRPRTIRRRTRHQISIPPGGPNLAESVFRIRPMTPEIMAYCANDVVHLPALHAEFMSRLSVSSPWHDRISAESDRRIAEAHGPDYSSVGPDKALSPWREIGEPALPGADTASSSSTAAVAVAAKVQVMGPVRSGSRTVLKFKPTSSMGETAQDRRQFFW